MCNHVIWNHKKLFISNISGETISRSINRHRIHSFIQLLHCTRLVFVGIESNNVIFSFIHSITTHKHRNNDSHISAKDLLPTQTGKERTNSLFIVIIMRFHSTLASLLLIFSFLLFFWFCCQVIFYPQLPDFYDTSFWFRDCLYLSLVSLHFLILLSKCTITENFLHTFIICSSRGCSESSIMVLHKQLYIVEAHQFLSVFPSIFHFVTKKYSENAYSWQIPSHDRHHIHSSQNYLRILSSFSIVFFRITFHSLELMSIGCVYLLLLLFFLWLLLEN